eukprot:11679141-Heterocapsa_arctica.AAC.1
MASEGMSAPSSTANSSSKPTCPAWPPLKPSATGWRPPLSTPYSTQYSPIFWSAGAFSRKCF